MINNCGCTVVWVASGDFLEARIEYCPKHAAAPALYEALVALYKLFINEYGDGLGNGYWPELASLSEQVSAALALADEVIAETVGIIAVNINNGLNFIAHKNGYHQFGANIYSFKR